MELFSYESMLLSTEYLDRKKEGSASQFGYSLSLSLYRSQETQVSTLDAAKQIELLLGLGNARQPLQRWGA
eukprot:1803700-Amphidinium_carterae.1